LDLFIWDKAHKQVLLGLSIKRGMAVNE
jgi:hypothetical protein